MRGQKRLYFLTVSAQTMAMTNTDQSSAGKPSIFVTRRWPADAEAALSQYFIPTFNLDDRPLSAAEMAAGFASHDAIDRSIAIAGDYANAAIAALSRLSSPGQSQMPIIAALGAAARFSAARQN